jgi:hypothetical protein
VDHEVRLTAVGSRHRRCPAGIASTTAHRGPFGDVGTAHDAVVRWSAEHGPRRTGIRREIYGPHDDDPARQWTEVSWLPEQVTGEC